MRLRVSEVDNYLVIFLFTMLCFGFIVSSFVPLFVGMSTTPFNILFRAIYLGVSIYLVIKGILWLPKERYSWTFWVLLLFIVFYCSRMVYDVYFQGLVFKHSIVNLFLFSFGGNFIPFVAIGLFAKRLNYDQLLKTTWYILFVSGLLILVLLYKIFGGFSIEMLAKRMALSAEEGRGNNINAITLSLYGSSLGLLSFYFLLFRNTFRKSILTFGILLGIALLVMGASRGPQVTFTLCFLYLLGTYTFKKYKPFRSKVRYTTMSGLVLVGLAALISQIDLTKIAMYNRFANFGDGLSSDTSARERTWSSAWGQFLEGPFIGDAYVVRPRYAIGYGTYPHNIYLETLMATGVLGALLFFTVLITFLLKRPTNINQVAIFVLFLIPLISSAFSANIFFNPNLFSALALMSGFSYINGKSLRAYD